MPKVRVLFALNWDKMPARLEQLREHARAVREEPGCLEFDYFRGVHFPENFAQVELWESTEAFDRHWLKAGAAALPCDARELCAPFHSGSADYPRRQGLNAIEFYRHGEFEKVGRRFLPKDPQARSTSIRWPSRSGVRIITQLCFDCAADEKLIAYSLETRQQAGCLEFDWLRSIEFPENLLHLELWSGPPSVYDEHYFSRTLQNLWGTGVARPFGPEQARRYGKSSFEFYEHCFYMLSGQVWEPEEPGHRLQSVQWP